MSFQSMFDFTSKTFLLGLLMVLAGVGKMLGIPFVVDVINSFYPEMDAGALISAGLAAIFVKDAIAKTGTTAIAFIGGGALLVAANDNGLLQIVA